MSSSQTSSLEEKTESDVETDVDSEDDTSNEEESFDVEQILKERPKKEVKIINENGIGRVEEYETAEKEYLCKLREKSYLHLQWLPADFFEKGSHSKSKLGKWMDRDKQDDLLYEGSPFNPDFATIDRIIASSGKGDDQEFLVKWRVLGYNESTWESRRDLIKLPNFDIELDAYVKLNSADAYRRAQVRRSRPKAQKIDEIELSLPIFNGHCLKSYQVEGVKWLIHSYYRNRNTILADEMGLGKTVQTAACLQYLHSHHHIHGPFLVIAPMSTIQQWKREIDTWTCLASVVLQGPQDAREMIFEYDWNFFEYSQDEAKEMGPLVLKKGEEKRRGNPLKFQVLITTYEILMAEAHKLAGIPWEYLAIDEGHRIKNKKSKLFKTLMKFNAAQKLILTGTPLQNGVEELWTLMHFLEPDKFDDFDGFMDEFGELKKSDQVAKLHEQIGTHIMRRVKEDVDPSIPQKEETIIELELTLVQKTYYKAVLEGNREFLNRGAAKNQLMNIMMQQRKICNHPYLMKGAEDSLIAKATEDPKKSESELTAELLISSSSKFVFLDKMLERLRKLGTRVLIFSGMVMLLDLLEDYLTQKQYPFERLDGNDRGSERQQAIDRFSNPNLDRFVFLLSTKAGGLGINLTIADTVILFDSDWNPQNDLQAQARVHRIGQQRPVKIYRLITKGTYEKYMFEVASKKLGLDRVLLQNMDKVDVEDKLTRDEVERLLKHGAYDMLKSETDKEPEFDFDAIMSSATTLKYGPEKSDGNSTNFSNFKASDEDDIDLNDEDFWVKVLPSFRTTNQLLQMLKENNFDQVEKRNQFFTNLQLLVEDAMLTAEDDLPFGQFDPKDNLLNILREILKRTWLSTSQRDQALTWQTLLEKPRLRRRKKREDDAKQGTRKRDRRHEEEDTGSQDSQEKEVEVKKKKSKKGSTQRGYQIYFKEMWPQYKDTHSMPEARQKISELYKALSDEEKEKYAEKARIAKEQKGDEDFEDEEKETVQQSAPTQPEEPLKPKAKYKAKRTPNHSYNPAKVSWPHTAPPPDFYPRMNQQAPWDQWANIRSGAPANTNNTFRPPNGVDANRMWQQISQGTGSKPGSFQLPGFLGNFMPGVLTPEMMAKSMGIPTKSATPPQKFEIPAKKTNQPLRPQQQPSPQIYNTNATAVNNPFQKGGSNVHLVTPNYQKPNSAPNNLQNMNSFNLKTSTSTSTPNLPPLSIPITSVPLSAPTENFNLKNPGVPVMMTSSIKLNPNGNSQVESNLKSGTSDAPISLDDPPPSPPSPVQVENSTPVSRKGKSRVEPYSYFVKTQYKKVKEEHPTWTTPMVQKQCSVLWKALTVAEKNKWADMASDAKKKNSKKAKVEKKPEKVQETKITMDDAYRIFEREMFPGIRKDNLSPGEADQKVRMMWKQMSDAEKHVYQDVARRELDMEKNGSAKPLHEPKKEEKPTRAEIPIPKTETHSKSYMSCIVQEIIDISPSEIVEVGEEDEIIDMIVGRDGIPYIRRKQTVTIIEITDEESMEYEINTTVVEEIN